MDFRISIFIGSPPEIVWAVMADAERWHEWTPSVRSIRLLDKPPLRVGSRALIRQPRFPPAVWTVTALATLALHYEGGLARLIGRLTRGITHRYLTYEAEGLKRRSEERTN